MSMPVAGMPTCRPRKVHHKNFNLNPRNLAKKTHTRKHTSLVISEYIYIYITRERCGIYI
jgi:hypothetical protein